MNVSGNSAKAYWNGDRPVPDRVLARIAIVSGRTADWFLFGASQDRAGEGEGIYRVAPRMCLPMVGRAAADDSGGVLRDLASADGIYRPDGPRGVMEVVGNSMAPVALDGQLVVVDMRDRTANEGNLVVVETTDERILTKRFHTRNGGLTLTSINPVDPQPPIHLEWEEVKAIRVVVGVMFE